MKCWKCQLIHGFINKKSLSIHWWSLNKNSINPKRNIEKLSVSTFLCPSYACALKQQYGPFGMGEKKTKLFSSCQAKWITMIRYCCNRPDYFGINSKKPHANLKDVYQKKPHIPRIDRKWDFFFIDEYCVSVYVESHLFILFYIAIDWMIFYTHYNTMPIVDSY